jgi:branched-chain amino acid transport system ATP-binding protein
MLEVRDLHAGYATARVLQGATLRVEARQVVALLGRNGMGKTTLLRSISGLRPPVITAGTISFDGTDLAGHASHEVARRGLSLVPQGRRVFRSLTVVENLRVAANPAGGRWTVERVFQLFPRLAERPRQVAATLSGGEQQMLAIGRSLMTNPRLLLMDEPSEGLSPQMRDLLADRLAPAARGGPGRAHRRAERRPCARGRRPGGRAGRIGDDHLVGRAGGAPRRSSVAARARGRLTRSEE